MWPALRTLVGQLNLRHVVERRLRTALTVVGVAAGVTLAVSISMINDTLVNSVRSTARELAGAAEIEVAGADRTGLPEKVVPAVGDVDGVSAAIPILRSYATVRGPDGDLRVLVTGMTAEFPRLFPRGLGEMGEIRLEGGFGDGSGLVLAEGVADRLGVKRGDTVALETPGGYRDTEVTGLVSSGLLATFNGGDVASMTLPAAQEAFQRPARVDSIFVITDKNAEVDDVEARIDERVDGAVVGPPGARAGGFADSLDGINAVTSVAGTVALFVAAFVVYNTMSMSVTERRREIAMTLTFGASRRQVFLSFLGEAVILGAIASALGIAAGALLAHLMAGQALEALRVFDITATGGVQLGIKHIIIGCVSGGVVAVFGALVPAKRVLKLAPVESLRPRGSYEAHHKPRIPRFVAPVVGTVMLIAAVPILVWTPERTRDLAWSTNAGLILGLVGATLVLRLFVSLGTDTLRPLVARAFGSPGEIAVDALSTNPGRTTLTVGALVFTLGIVVGVGSAIDSFQAQWNRSARRWFSSPLVVAAESYGTIGSDQPLPASAEQALERVDGVQAAYAERYRVVKIGDRQTAIYIVPATQAKAEGANLAPEGIEFRDEIVQHLEPGEIVISRGMANRRDLEIGDSLTIPTPSGDQTFSVQGLKEDLNSLDSMYLDASQFLRYWKDDRADRFGITLEEGANINEVKAELEEVIRQEGLAATVATRESEIGRMFESIAGLFSVARGIQFAALVVAALAIANTMFITTFERRWELGLQQAMGMGRRQLVQSLLTEAAVIGAIGGLGAVLLGAGIGIMMLHGLAASYSFQVPFQPAWGLAAVALTVGVAIAALAGVYPTRRAARVPIIESLRYE